MELISEEYRALNAREHEANNGYGVNGHRHLKTVLNLVDRFGAATVLDYGCGQANLSKHAKRVSPALFINYDPAVPLYSALPAPADVVACTDVLEHVEPLNLSFVLEHIASLTNKAAFFEIACRPAKRVLSDGRNAHINLHDGLFWFDTLRWYFDIVEMHAQPKHSVQLVCVPRGSVWE